METGSGGKWLRVDTHSGGWWLLCLLIGWCLFYLGWLSGSVINFETLAMDNEIEEFGIENIAYEEL